MRSTGQLGDKLGPRLVQLVSQSVLTTRRGLAGHEARVLHAGLKMTIDAMGEEHANLIRPLTDALITSGDLPPELHDSIARAASGHHQWEARALQGIVAGTAQSALGTVLSNYLFPITGELVSRRPQLVPDPPTLAQLAARGWVGQGVMFTEAARQGIGQQWEEALLNAAHSWPDLGTLLMLEQRGVLGEGGLYNYLRIAGYNAETIPILRHLTRTLLTPDQAALAVVRNVISEQFGSDIASRGGLDHGDFKTMLDITGEPLGLEQLEDALRRGLIDREKFARGFRQSRYRDEWLDTAVALRFGPMTTADAADAALRGHLTQDQARKIAEENGLEPSQWPAYYANQGNPPAPEQLLELWRRKHISEADVDRGLREGRTRNDWIPAVKHLRTERLPTADALDAWLRGHLTKAAAEQIAEENGLAPQDLAAAFGNAGNPLGLGELMDALRRGFIDRARFDQGFRQSRYRDEWAETAYRLRQSPMSTADAIRAAVQGHLPLDRARKIAEENGLEPADFEPLYLTEGNPPSPTELFSLENRGRITRGQVVQGLREGRLKDSWIPDVIALRERLPQEYQVVRMLASGAVSHAEGIRLLTDLGYSPRIAGLFVTEAELTGTGPHRQAAAGQVTALYESHLIDRATAAGMLVKLRYTEHLAQLLLDLADHRRHQAILDTAVTAVRKTFLVYGSDELEARADLHDLNLPQDAVDAYLTAWQIERKAVTRTLTEAQIVKAHKSGLFDTDQDPDGTLAATTRLTRLGYSIEDADLLLAGA